MSASKYRLMIAMAFPSFWLTFSRQNRPCGLGHLQQNSSTFTFAVGWLNLSIGSSACKVSSELAVRVLRVLRVVLLLLLLLLLLLSQLYGTLNKGARHALGLTELLPLGVDGGVHKLLKVVESAVDIALEASAGAAAAAAAIAVVESADGVAGELVVRFRCGDGVAAADADAVVPAGEWLRSSSAAAAAAAAAAGTLRDGVGLLLSMLLLRLLLQIQTRGRGSCRKRETKVCSIFTAKNFWPIERRLYIWTRTGTLSGASDDLGEHDRMLARAHRNIHNSRDDVDSQTDRQTQRTASKTGDVYSQTDRQTQRTASKTSPETDTAQQQVVGPKPQINTRNSESTSPFELTLA